MTNILSLPKVIVVFTMVALFGCETQTYIPYPYPHMWDPPAPEDQPPVPKGPSPDAGCNIMSDLFKGTSGYGGTVVQVDPAVAPGVAPLGFGDPQTVQKFPGHMRKFSWPQDQDPALITASVYAEPNPSASFAGPMTGIALWGSGGSATNVAEFDIPVGTSIDPDFALTDPRPFDTPRGGTFITVVGSSLEIRARNDANLLPAGPFGDGTFQAPIGNFGAAAVAGTAPVFVSAALGKGTKTTTHTATKTVWAVNTILAAGGVAPGANIFVRIPPYAKSFRIARGSASPPANLHGGAIRFAVFGNTFAGDGTYDVANNVIAPEVRISGQDTTIEIINAEAADTILRLYVIFFLAI